MTQVTGDVFSAIADDRRAAALAAIPRGELRGTPELRFVLGKMYLAGFAAAQGS